MTIRLLHMHIQGVENLSLTRQEQVRRCTQVKARIPSRNTNPHTNPTEMPANSLHPFLSLGLTAGAHSLPQCTQNGVFGSISFPHAEQVVQGGAELAVSIPLRLDRLRDVPHPPQNWATSGLS